MEELVPREPWRDGGDGGGPSYRFQNSMRAERLARSTQPFHCGRRCIFQAVRHPMRFKSRQRACLPSVQAPYRPSASCAPIIGISLTRDSRNTLGFAVNIFLALRSLHAKVCTRLATTTDGCSRPIIGTSVIAPRMLVLIGQQMRRPLLRL